MIGGEFLAISRRALGNDLSGIRYLFRIDWFGQICSINLPIERKRTCRLHQSYTQKIRTINAVILAHLRHDTFNFCSSIVLGQGCKLAHVHILCQVPANSSQLHITLLSAATANSFTHVHTHKLQGIQGSSMLYANTLPIGVHLVRVNAENLRASSFIWQSNLHVHLNDR